MDEIKAALSEKLGSKVAFEIPLFGGIPATGAIARTMTNINNGGRTPVAGIVHAVVLLLILLVCVIQIIFDLAARKADKRTR